MNSEPNPRTSVIVCTRDRPDQLDTALRSILASSYDDFELLVVDQSTTDASRGIVERFAQRDQRVRLRPDSGTGVSRARNIGLAATSGELVVFTDDDCEVGTDWLEAMVRALDEDPEAGIAFGSVVPVECDPKEGFIVGYVPPLRERLTGRLAKLQDGGIGANMAFRRRAIQAVGGFDEMLGPGAYFPSCEDGDVAYRVLASGKALLHVPEARVLHHGFRDWRSGSLLTRRTYIAIAAAYTKYVRLGDRVAILLLLQQVQVAALNVVTCLLRGNRPLGLRRLFGLAIGIIRSFELGIDRRTASYRHRFT
jgi:O-antigen biosynthesis protein